MLHLLGRTVLSNVNFTSTSFIRPSCLIYATGIYLEYHILLLELDSFSLAPLFTVTIHYYLLPSVRSVSVLNLSRLLWYILVNYQ